MLQIHADKMSSSSSFMDQPVTSLSSCTFQRLGGDITLVTPKNRDWRGLASYVGFTCKQVGHIQQHKDSGKGFLFLETWDATGESSIKKLLFALLEYKMRAAIGVIQDDENISDDDFEATITEYQQLKQNGLLKPCHPISDDKILSVLYPRNTTYPPVRQPTECQVERLATQPCALPEVSIVPKTVYISYVDSKSSSEPTKKLADFLSKQGYKVHYKPACSQEIRKLGLDGWKERCIQTCEDIIVVCTSTYCHEDSKFLMEKSSKIAVDSRLLRVLAYCQDPEQRQRLIPVIIDSKKPKNFAECVPIWIRAAQPHHWPSGSTDLLFCLKKMKKYTLAEPNPEDIIVIKPKVIGFPKPKGRNVKK